MWLILPVIILILGAADVAMAQTRIAPGDDVGAAINALGPGDELILAGGEYTLTGRLSVDIAGTEAAPILIRAADGETPHLHRPNANQNIMDLDRAEYVTFRGIEFSGGSAGVRLSAVRFVTIEDCEIHDSGDVALRANDTGQTYDSLRILRNHIHHTNNTGEGMYLGCNNDGCRMIHSLIEGNHIHHTNQASVSQGDGIEIKEGSYGNVIRDNVIHDTNYPCILVYGTVGNGPVNVIEGNLLWNCGDHGIQAAADATIRNNIILSANADGIAMQPHQSGDPANLVVVHNTVLQVTGDALSLRGIAGLVTIANNALYAESGRGIYVGGGDLSDLRVAGNVGVGGATGTPGGGWTEGALNVDFVAAHFIGTPPIDVYPALAGGLVGVADAAHVVADDFNGDPRGDALAVGAYGFSSGGNTGWPLAAGFKRMRAVPDTPAADAGAADPGSDGATDPVKSDAAMPGEADGSRVDGELPGGPVDAGPGVRADGGCGCRLQTRLTPTGALWPALLALALWSRRRACS